MITAYVIQANVIIDKKARIHQFNPINSERIQQFQKDIQFMNGAHEKKKSSNWPKWGAN